MCAGGMVVGARGDTSVRGVGSGADIDRGAAVEIMDESTRGSAGWRVVGGGASSGEGSLVTSSFGSEGSEAAICTVVEGGSIGSYDRKSNAAVLEQTCDRRPRTDRADDVRGDVGERTPVAARGGERWRVRGSGRRCSVECGCLC